MMGPAGLMDWENFNESFPAYLTIAVMPLTYSIANGVVAGLLCYVLIDLLTSKWWAPYVARICGGSYESALSKPLISRTPRRPSVSASPHAVCRPTTPVSTPTDARPGLEIRSVRA